MGLSITLKVGEVVDIGEARVKITSASSGRAQLLISAPLEIPILREKAKLRCPKNKNSGSDTSKTEGGKNCGT
jgi:sRNA-binding carbon storage regulator CsrA